MRFFVYFPGAFKHVPVIEQGALEADDLGFDGLLVSDHYMWGGERTGQQENATPEAWILLTYLAAKTRRIRLGTLVSPIPFRPPGMLAKMVSTLDRFSEGRCILGVGAGWSQTEFEGYSVWNDAKTRVSKTEEGVKLILKLWTENVVNFDGEYYRAKGAVLEPKPIQKPHPPLLFGGGNRQGKRMLQLAGTYGDICYLTSLQHGGVEEAKRRINATAQGIGRAEKLEFAVGELATPPAKVQVGDLEEAASKGATYYVVSLLKSDRKLEDMRAFAKDLMPSFQ